MCGHVNMIAMNMFACKTNINMIAMNVLACEINGCCKMSGRIASFLLASLRDGTIAAYAKALGAFRAEIVEVRAVKWQSLSEPERDEVLADRLLGGGDAQTVFGHPCRRAPQDLPQRAVQDRFGGPCVVVGPASSEAGAGSAV